MSEVQLLTVCANSSRYKIVQDNQVWKIYLKPKWCYFFVQKGWVVSSISQQVFKYTATFYYSLTLYDKQKFMTISYQLLYCSGQHFSLHRTSSYYLILWIFITGISRVYSCHSLVSVRNLKVLLLKKLRFKLH